MEIELINEKCVILLDLDGTIISDDYLIYEEIRRKIEMYSKNNYVFLVTGRSLSDSLRYYYELNLKTPIICYNGGFVYYPTERKKVFCRYMIGTQQILNLIFLEFKSDIENIIISKGEKTFYLNQENPFLCEMMIEPSLENRLISWNEILMLKNCHRIVLSISNAHQSEIVHKLKAKFDSVDIFGWKGRDEIIDISGNLSDKWDTSLRVLEKMNLCDYKVIAIGDARNDISMIKNADIGVAMLNAGNEVKRYADYITEYDNNNNGVYYFFEKLEKMSVI